MQIHLLSVLVREEVLLFGRNASIYLHIQGFGFIAFFRSFFTCFLALNNAVVYT